MIDPIQCPWCESRDWSLIGPEAGAPHFQIRCNGCSARGPDGYSRDNAVYYWNRRPVSEEPSR